MQRILVVDDEAVIAFDIRDILLRAGFGDVELALDVRGALAALASSTFDLAILDGNLNGDSAEPVAKALLNRNIPFLVVSGYSEAQRSGALASAEFLGKPFSPDELIVAVRSAMRKT